MTEHTIQRFSIGGKTVDMSQPDRVYGAINLVLESNDPESDLEYLREMERLGDPVDVVLTASDGSRVTKTLKFLSKPQRTGSGTVSVFFTEAGEDL